MFSAFGNSGASSPTTESPKIAAALDPMSPGYGRLGRPSRHIADY